MTLSAENGYTKIIQLLIEHGIEVTAQNNPALKLTAKNGHTETAHLLIEHGGYMEALTITERKNQQFEQRVQNVTHWKKICRSSPPKGLVGLNPEGFKPLLFETAKEWMEIEGYKGNEAEQYAYKASVLFGNEDRILQYLEQWGQIGNQPLHDLVYMIDLPLTGKIDNKAWGDAVLRFGPEMAKFVKFAGKLEKPAPSLNKTRERCATFRYERGSEHPELAALCVAHSVNETSFDNALTLVQKVEEASQTEEILSRIPNMTIKGDDFGMNGATFAKLSDGDVKGLFLG